MSAAISLVARGGTARALGEEEYGGSALSDGATKQRGAALAAAARVPDRARRKALDYEMARAYWAMLGGGTSHSRWGRISEEDFRGGRLVRWWSDPGWDTRHGRPDTWEVAVALERGATRIAPRGLTHVRHIVVDVDVHGDPPDGGKSISLRGSREKRGLDEYLRARAREPKERARRAREWRAARARPVVDRLLETGLVDFVETSPHGFHAVVVLREKVPVAQAAEIARRLAAAAGTADGVKVESFPRMRSDATADHCAMPLTGPQRWIGRDLVTPLHRRRVDAIRDLLRVEGRDLEDLEHVLGEVDAATDSPASITAETASLVAVTASPLVDGQLFRADYVREVLRLLEGGLRKGESYGGVRRVVASCRYTGHTTDETIAIVGAWIAAPIHDARHCGTPAGRRQLLALARAQLRHFERGLSSGRCYLGGLRSRELRSALGHLLAASRRRRQDGQDEEVRPCMTNSMTASHRPTAGTARRIAAAAALESSAASTASYCRILRASSRVEITLCARIAGGGERCTSSPRGGHPTKLSSTASRSSASRSAEQEKKPEHDEGNRFPSPGGAPLQAQAPRRPLARAVLGDGGRRAAGG